MQNKTKNLYPWLVWGLAASFFFYKYLLEVSPSVMSHELMQTFHIDGTMMGNLAACYFYAYFLMQLPVGIMLDRFSPRILTTVAILFAATGALVLAHAHWIVTAGVGRFITGIGAAFAAISCLKLTGLWFPPKRFAMMAGLMMSVGFLGAVGGGAPLSMAVTHFGWRDTLIYWSVLGFAFAVVFWILVRDKKTEPSENNLESDSPKFFTGVWRVLKNKQTWLVSIYSGLAFAPMAVFSGLWGIPYLQLAYHIPRTASAFEISIAFIGFGIIGPIVGWFSDYLGKRKPVMYWGTSIALISVLLILYIPHLPLWILGCLMFLFGASLSCFLLSFSMVREYNPLILTATAVGLMNTLNAAFCAISDPFVGKLLDIGWKGVYSHGVMVFPLLDYKWALLTIPVYLVFALILLVFVKETHCKQAG